jgi:enediyne polyketide synthase
VKHQIAVIGVGCYYPGAKDKKELWGNILSRRRQFREIPSCRLPISDYYNKNNSPDKTYSRHAAVIDGFQFDWSKNRIPKTTYDSSDIVHWLALDVATQALLDAGYSPENVPKNKTGVLLGNSLAGEFTRSQTMRMRWPFIRKTLRVAGHAQGLSGELLGQLEQQMESTYKSVFAPVTEDSLAGWLSNTIAGRICNFFDLHGGGYVVDGACSSSLLAVATASDKLVKGDLDLALAGGVDISLDPMEIIGFAKAGTLTDQDMNVYDRKASGFIPGEGCGFLILKRLADARLDEDYIYAVINGWGISSDGKGSITAPKSEGQALALRRAYELAGYSPHELDFIEGHGTGTVLGDRIELDAIASMRDSFGKAPNRSCGVTSFKSLVGHTKAAAGIGGLIKAVLSVNQRILVPTAACREPNDIFNTSALNIYPILKGEVYASDKKMRAGVSAMGFGGINCHITLESGDQPNEDVKPEIEARALMASPQDTELIIITAETQEELVMQVNQLREEVAGISIAELADLSYHLTKQIDAKKGKIRVAIVTNHPDQLVEQLQILSEVLISNFPDIDNLYVNKEKQIWLSNQVSKHRVGFLYPGQGSQKINMALTLIERYPWAREIANSLWELLPEGKEMIFRPLEKAINQTDINNWEQQLQQTAIAQPTICLASVLWTRFLANLGITADLTAGHSLGELTAFYAAGGYNEKTLFQLAITRGKAMATSPDKTGTMLSLRCDHSEANRILDHVSGYAIVANLNSPIQTVISGEKSSIDQAKKIAEDRQILAVQLPVSNAFHSDMVKNAADIIRDNKHLFNINSLSIPVISGPDGKIKQKDAQNPDYFANQILNQVNFISTIKILQEQCDLLFEIGPGCILTGLVEENLPDEMSCFPIESKVGMYQDLHHLLATYFTHGGNIQWQALYESRLIHPFVPAYEREFIVNPCELPLVVSDATTFQNQIQQNLLSATRLPAEVLDIIPADLKHLNTSPSLVSTTQTIEESLPLPEKLLDTVPQKIIRIVAERTGFQESSIQLDHRLLDDLNLDSIKSAELVVSIAKEFGGSNQIDPTQFANATLQEIIQALETLVVPSNEVRTEITVEIPNKQMDSSDLNWVRNFSIEYVASPELNSNNLQIDPTSRFLIITEESKNALSLALAKELQVQNINNAITTFDAMEKENRLQNEAISHLVVILPKKENNENLASIIRRLQSVVQPVKGFGYQASITYIQYGGGFFGTNLNPIHLGSCSANAFASGLHLERPNAKIRVIDLCPSIRPKSIVKHVLAEISVPEAFVSVGYDKKKIRRTPQAMVQQPNLYTPRSIKWTKEDVLLVTGGGQGITAECALALAKTNGVKMALVGRSSLNETIQQTLDRYRQAGLDAHYFQCDITDQKQVIQLVNSIEEKLGQVTGIIHGAGIVRPRRAEQVSQGDFIAEIAPKLLGTMHLCEALKDHPPKLFIGFTSITSITGMVGNTSYGFANETLQLLLRRFEQEHPETQVLSIAYSVWDEVGMGTRDGSINFLKQKGIYPIPLKEGVERFTQLFHNNPQVKQVVIAAKLDGLDTWHPRPVKRAKPLRYIEKVIHDYPGIAVTVQTHLDLSKDSYVQDHVFNGTHLFPAVFGLEAMAQATAYVTGIEDFSRVQIEDIQFELPIVVNPETGVTIQIHAEVLEDKRVKAEIRTEQNGFSKTHFIATFVWGEKTRRIKQKVIFPDKALPIEPKKDLYGSILFQGPRYHRIHEVYETSHDANGNTGQCLFTTTQKTVDEYLLGDPYYHDALLQSAQLTMPQDRCLPVSIKSFERFPNQTATWKAVTRLQEKSGSYYIFTVDVVNEKNQIIQQLKGYETHILEHIPSLPTAVELSSSAYLDEQRLNHAIKKQSKLLSIELPTISVAHLPNIHQLKTVARHELVQSLFQRIITKSGLDGDYSLKWDDSGKPIVHQEEETKAIQISFSHDDEITICTLGTKPQGSDILPMEIYRDQGDWHNLLPSQHQSLFQVLIDVGQTITEAGYRVWTALEAIKKASQTDLLTMRLVKTMDDTFLFEAKTEKTQYTVLTLPVKLSKPTTRMTAIVVDSQKIAINVTKNTPTVSSTAYTFGEFHPEYGFVHRFPLTFPVAFTIGRHVDSTSYAGWMGKIRELSLTNIRERVRKQFATGRWGMITNFMQVEVFGEVGSHDVMEAHMQVEQVRDDSYMEFVFHWYKVLEDNTLELIATSKQGLTWVEIIGIGMDRTVKTCPYPNYFRQYVAENQPIMNHQRPVNSKESSVLSPQLLGKKQVEVKAKPNNRFLLHQNNIDTSLKESDLVGNIFFANYSIWQTNVRDQFFYRLAPALYQGTGEQGEWITLSSKIHYLREAVPFDQIEVQMSLIRRYEYGVTLFFEFFRVDSQHQRQKLAYGEQDIIWINRDEQGIPHPAPIPAIFDKELLYLPI